MEDTHKVEEGYDGDTILETRSIKDEPIAE